VEISKTRTNVRYTIRIKNIVCLVFIFIVAISPLHRKNIFSRESSWAIFIRAYL